MPETKITNEQIATEVMGWKKEIRKTTGLVMGYIVWIGAEGEVLNHRLAGSNSYFPDFLTDHNAAMLVVEKMREKFTVGIVDMPKYHTWRVTLFEKTSEYSSTNKSLCVAICEAALKAVRS